MGIELLLSIIGLSVTVLGGGFAIGWKIGEKLGERKLVDTNPPQTPSGPNPFEEKLKKAEEKLKEAEGKLKQIEGTVSGETTIWLRESNYDKGEPARPSIPIVTI